MARKHLVVGDVSDDPRPLNSDANTVEGLLKAPRAPAEEVHVVVHLVDQGRVTGERFAGAWDNVGTPDQLEALDRRLSR